MDKKILIGADEVGTGCIAGPIIVAAVAAYEGWTIPGLRDSKKLSAKKREELMPVIAQQTIAMRVEAVSVSSIDAGFQTALMTAMRNVILQAADDAGDVHLTIVDGNNNPFRPPQDKAYCVRCEPKADDKYPTVSAASVIAKVRRDEIMTKLGYDFPSYKFAEHKGYPTKEHLALLEKHGPCLEHRRSSAPVKRILEKRNAK